MHNCVREGSVVSVQLTPTIFRPDAAIEQIDTWLDNLASCWQLASDVELRLGNASGTWHLPVRPQSSKSFVVGIISSMEAGGRPHQTAWGAYITQVCVNATALLGGEAIVSSLPIGGDLKFSLENLREHCVTEDLSVAMVLGDRDWTQGFELPVIAVGADVWFEKWAALALLGLLKLEVKDLRGKTFCLVGDDPLYPTLAGLISAAGGSIANYESSLANSDSCIDGVVLGHVPPKSLKSVTVLHNLITASRLRAKQFVAVEVPMLQCGLHSERIIDIFELMFNIGCFKRLTHSHWLASMMSTISIFRPMAISGRQR